MPDPIPNYPVKALPPSFREIAQLFTRDQPSPVNSEAPQEVRPPNLMVGSAMVMLLATWISQNEATGITYADTVTTSVGQVALETAHMVADPRGSILEDITDITKLWMADDHPE